MNSLSLKQVILMLNDSRVDMTQSSSTRQVSHYETSYLTGTYQTFTQTTVQVLFCFLLFYQLQYNLNKNNEI